MGSGADVYQIATATIAKADSPGTFITCPFIALGLQTTGEPRLPHTKVAQRAAIGRRRCPCLNGVISHVKGALFLACLIPLWVSDLVRAYGWMILLPRCTTGC